MLHIWKKKFGSSCTYNKLIEVFEHAGYQSYADSVRRVVQDIEIQTSDECSLLTSQPETYPNPLFKSQSHLPPQSQPLELSQYDQYICVKSTEEMRKLPKGKDSVFETLATLIIIMLDILVYCTSGEVYTSDQLRSCKVSNVPLLRSSNTVPEVFQEEMDAKWRELCTTSMESMVAEINVRFQVSACKLHIRSPGK